MSIEDLTATPGGEPRPSQPAPAAALRARIEEYAERERVTRRADRVHPVLRLLCPILLLVGVLVSGSWLVFVAFAVAVLAAALALGAGALYWSRFWKVGLTVGLFTMVIRSLFVYGDHVVLHVGPFTATAEGVESGLWYTAMLFAVCAPIILVTSIMGVADLTRALEQMRAPRELTYIVMSSVRMIPELGVRSRSVQDAQRSRGIQVDGSRLVRLKALLPTIGPLVLSALSGVEERAVAMEVRGFGITKGATSMMRARPITSTDFVVLAVVAVASLLLGLGVRLS